MRENLIIPEVFAGNLLKILSVAEGQIFNILNPESSQKCARKLQQNTNKRFACEFKLGKAENIYSK